MNDERYRIRQILETAPSITAGMAEWVKHCQNIHSDLIWEFFQSIEYEVDIEHMIHRLEVLFIIDPPPSDVGLYYFGMFTPRDHTSSCDLVFYGFDKDVKKERVNLLKFARKGSHRERNQRLNKKNYWCNFFGNHFYCNLIC